MIMKKTGILTEHRARNFGSCLQAYALQNTIKKLGHDVEIVDYRPQAIENSFGVIIVDLFRQCEKNPVKILKFIVNTVIFSPLRIARELKFYRFRKKMFALSKIKFNKVTKDVLDNVDYDAFVCGSDQIWNPKITDGLDEVYFAKPFSSKSRKISYAASVGLSEIQQSEKVEFSENLNQMNVVTVREKSAKELLQPLTDKDISLVLDPTLLMKKEEWVKLFEDRIAPKQKYILVYSLKVDEEMISYAKKLSEEKQLPVLFFDLRKRYGKNSISKFTAEPIEFLYYLYYAEYVVTNSFHGTVFSTQFEKKFVCVPMQGTSSRMVDLLDMLQLNGRLISKEFKIDEPVNYENAKKILNEERNRSMEILKKALS